MKPNAVILHKNKDKAVRNRHPWIFSGAVKTFPEAEEGSILPVKSFDGDLLGHAYFNSKCSLIGRMVSFGAQPPLDALRDAVESAIGLRRHFFDDGVTSAYRLIHGEADRIPGLTVDRFNDHLVVQIATLGMDKLKTFLVEALTENLAPSSIYEKSDMSSRREEGLPEAQGLLAGHLPDGPLEIRENGLRFLVDIVHSQKTGFFLDQREMRRLVGTLAAGRKVLDCFCFTGGFSVYALNGGARSATCVDASDQALSLARENIRLNGFDPERQDLLREDVFRFLRDRVLDHDLVILDPPAFAKKKNDVVQACRGYKDINRLAMKNMPRRSLLFTCSCSHHVDEALFQQVIFQSAQEAGREVRILERHRQAFDHPVSVFHPESRYLKGFLLYID